MRKHINTTFNTVIDIPAGEYRAKFIQERDDTRYAFVTYMIFEIPALNKDGLKATVSMRIDGDTKIQCKNGKTTTSEEMFFSNLAQQLKLNGADEDALLDAARDTEVTVWVMKNADPNDESRVYTNAYLYKPATFDAGMLDI